MVGGLPSPQVHLGMDESYELEVPGDGSQPIRIQVRGRVNPIRWVGRGNDPCGSRLKHQHVSEQGGKGGRSVTIARGKVLPYPQWREGIAVSERVHAMECM